MSASKTEIDLLRREPVRKACEQCGAVFSCGAASGSCWCDAVKLSGDALANLRTAYRDCLCPRCLPSAGNVKLIP